MKNIFTVTIVCLSLFTLGCGEEGKGDDSMRGDGGANLNGGSANSGGGSCYTSDECGDGTYCRATDPIMSAEGVCTALEPAGAACVYGTDCQPNLLCKKPRGEVRGACLAFPADCADQPGCNCALMVCDTFAGSSCSPTDLDNPADTITVYCAP